jgi:hypothetical protein
VVAVVLGRRAVRTHRRLGALELEL